jgi:hypothetical protein
MRTTPKGWYDEATIFLRLVSHRARHALGQMDGFPPCTDHPPAHRQELIILGRDVVV